MQLSMHKVYICTLGADKYADFMHTLWDRLEKCASSLQMHTLCRLYMQTVCRPEMIFWKSVHKVCKCTLDADLWHILCRLCAYYWVFFKLVFGRHSFGAMSMSYTLTLTCSVDKNIRQRLGLKIHAHLMHTFFGCMHTMCTLFLGACTLFSDIQKTTFFTELYRLLPISC